MLPIEETGSDLATGRENPEGPGFLVSTTGSGAEEPVPLGLDIFIVRSPCLNPC